MQEKIDWAECPRENLNLLINFTKKQLTNWELPELARCLQAFHTHGHGIDWTLKTIPFIGSKALFSCKY